MSNRIYLNELRSCKDNENYVSVKFKRGLNIISGASNTGKSYILECIDYLFGATRPPRKIDEGLDYEFVLLEIETSQNKKYTLKRFFDGSKKSKVLLFDSNIDNIAGMIPKDLISRHGENSISSEILSLIGLNEKKLLDKAKTGKTVDLSLRILSNFLIVDETNIIAQRSPVYRDPFEKNKNSAAFKLLISGQDDSKIKIISDKPEIFRSKLSAKIEFLDELITKATNDLKQLGDNFDNYTLESSISELKIELSNNNQLIDEKIIERNFLFKSRDALNDKLLEQERLLSRYLLLQEHYQNDLKRIEFIEEGSFYLNQLENVPCPICCSKTIPAENDFQRLIESCNKETQKTSLKINGLLDTINKTSLMIENLTTEISNNNHSIDKITFDLNQELLPISKKLSNSISKILETQSILNQKNGLKQQIDEHTTQKNSFQKMLDDYKETTVSSNLDSSYYKDFGKEVSNLLTSWRYKEDSTIHFDEKALDITINGTPRINQGKGHRAITYTAFVIGLMKYTHKNNLNNAGFVIIDSPLLNLKEKATSKEDEVEDYIQNAFWDNLSDTPDEEQIIIIENKEPKQELKNKVNFIQFTADDNDGRRGFY